MNGVRNKTGTDGVVGNQEWLKTISSKKSKLSLICGFAALAALALAISCRGFFPGITYTSITISPTPSVPLGSTQGLELWGTDSTTTQTAQITSGAYWSVSTGTTGSATITNSGVATGTAIGSITVNATYQGLSTSASGVVYLTNISSICVSTTGTSGSCSTSSEDISAANPVAVNLYAVADYTNGSGQTETIDITTSATWTVGGPTPSDLTCDNSSSPAVCTFDNVGTSGTGEGTYPITVSYPQTSITGTNTIIVTP